MCSRINNDELVSALIKKKFLKSHVAVEAMSHVDRRWFIPKTYSAAEAYQDRPLYIGYGATISAPHMHAIALEAMDSCLRDVPNSSCARNDAIYILDIGSGSGYLTAVMAHICSTYSAKSTCPWKVIGIEHVKELQESSLCAIGKHFPLWVEEAKVEIICGDGRNPLRILEKQTNNPVLSFDFIHVGAAIESVSESLLDILKPNACLIAPLGKQDQTQVLTIFRKDAQGKVIRDVNCMVSFIPLTSIYEQLQKN